MSPMVTMTATGLNYHGTRVGRGPAKVCIFEGPRFVRTTTLQECGANFFSIFLCPIWREILSKFSACLVFEDLGVRNGKFLEISRQKQCEKRRKISRKVHSAVACYDVSQARILGCRKIEAEKPQQKSRITKRNTAFTRTFFEKFAWTSVCFPVTWVRKPAEIVQKLLFRWTFFYFGVEFFLRGGEGWDFPPVTKGCSTPNSLGILRETVFFSRELFRHKTHLALWFQPRFATFRKGWVFWTGAARFARISHLRFALAGGGRKTGKEKHTNNSVPAQIDLRLGLSRAWRLGLNKNHWVLRNGQNTVSRVPFIWKLLHNEFPGITFM